MVVDSASGTLYLADFVGSALVIRKAVVASQSVLTIAGQNSGFADGIGTNAAFGNAANLAMSSNGNLYVSDYNNHRIRQIVIATQDVTTLAGSGVNGIVDATGVAARFSFPAGIVDDSNGNLYVVNSQTAYCIRKIVILSGVVTTVAGNGAGTMSGTGGPVSISSSIYNLHFGGNRKLYFNDFDSSSNSAFTGMFDIGTGQVTSFSTISSSDQDGIAADSSGNFYVADRNNCRIRVFNMSVQSPTPTHLAGSQSDCGTFDGIGANIRLTPVMRLAADSVNGVLYIYEPYTFRIRVLKAVAPCTAGKWCPASSSLIDQGGPCPAGYWCPQGSDRVASPAGTYSAGVGLAVAPSPTLSCSAGSYCPAGSYAINQAGLCPVGYFCAAGADRVNCTAGKYCAAGSATRDANGLCTAGYYCPSGRERVACVGAYCAAGEATANRVPCPQGYKCPGGGVVQEQCTAGTYADVGSSVCTQCPRGLVSASAGSS